MELLMKKLCLWVLLGATALVGSVVFIMAGLGGLYFMPGLRAGVKETIWKREHDNLMEWARTSP